MGMSLTDADLLPGKRSNNDKERQHGRFAEGERAIPVRIR